MYFPIFGKYSMMVTNGENGAKWRRLFHPGFTANNLKLSVGTMLQKLDRLLQSIDRDIAATKPTRTFSAGATFSFQVIVKVIFGVDLDQEKNDETQKIKDDML